MTSILAESDVIEEDYINCINCLCICHTRQNVMVYFV